MDEIRRINPNLVAGTLGGLSATVLLYPLELVKTRMQVTDKRSVSGYSSMRGAFRLVHLTEGFQGFYRGMSPAVLASSIAWGGYFYFYEMSKERRLRSQASSSTTATGKLGAIDHVLAGIESGSIMVMVTNPLWLIRTRLALQDSHNAIAVSTIPSASVGTGSSNSTSSSSSSSSSISNSKINSNNKMAPSRRYKGLFDAFATVWREEGIRGLYRGVVPALFLTSHGSIQFATYEYLKDWSSSIFGPSQPMWVSTLAGGFSKIAASTVTYPYQVIKSRLQQRESGMQQQDIGERNISSSKPQSAATISSASPLPTSEVEPKYINTRDCISKIWRNEGFVGFFRGFSLNIVKVAPSAAITFVVYEETKKLFS